MSESSKSEVTTGERKRDKVYFSRIGRKGGSKTRDSHGSSFFAEIGRKGGKKRSENWTRKRAESKEVLEPNQP